MVRAMVLILDGKKKICDCSRGQGMPYADHITVITSYVRTYYWATIWYEQQGSDISRDLTRLKNATKQAQVAFIGSEEKYT